MGGPWDGGLDLEVKRRDMDEATGKMTSRGSRVEAMAWSRGGGAE
jgi:hypothetical protein